MIKLQFSSTSQIGSRFISYGTYSWASHVDFVLPDGRLLGAVTKTGVSFHPPHEAKVIRRLETFLVDAPDSVIDYAIEQLGKPYDWPGILNFVTRNRNWEDTDSWFCSELVAYAFKKAGHPLIRADTYRITPGNILMSPYLIPIKELP